MSPAEIEALVAQIGDEILGRLGMTQADLAGSPAPVAAPASAWRRPEAGYASALELVCGSPEATFGEIAVACRRAREAGVPVVWTSPWASATAMAELAGTSTQAGALIDFPHGASTTPARLADIETALRLGVGLVSLTLGTGRVRAGDPDVLRAEVRAASVLCVDAGAPLAVVLEAELLSEGELLMAAAAALDGGADALCTSTGRLAHGFASDRAVALLRKAAADRAVVVAGGRIAGFGHAAALVAAGADRIAAADPWAMLEGAPV